jgi:hypothetical protein
VSGSRFPGIGKAIPAFAVFFFSIAAEARVYDLYRADYPKGAFCEAMGAACAADADIVNSFFQNPAVLASGRPDWNFDGDFKSKTNLEPGMAAANTVSEYVTDGGFALSSGSFGFGVSFLQQKDSVDGSITLFDGNNAPFKSKMSAEATLQQISVPVALELNKYWSIGVAPTFLSHRQSLGIDKATDKTTNNPSSSAFGLTFGTLFQPSRKFRLGSWFRIPTSLYEHLGFSATVGSTSVAYEEDFALHFPWIWATGLAYNLGRSTSLFLETDVIGPTYQGYLLSYDTLSSAVGDRNLVQKGKSVTAEPHWGFKSGLSRKFTLHAGGYYEASRWAGLGGRLHTTGGLSVKLAEWLEVIGGVDVAPKFTQVIFTIR